MTITCEVCGTANPEGTTYCEGCGVELTAQTPPTSGAAAASPAAPSTPAEPASTVLTPPMTDLTAPASPAATSAEAPSSTEPASSVGDGALPNSALPEAETAPDMSSVNSNPVVSITPEAAPAVEDGALPPPTDEATLQTPVSEGGAAPEPAPDSGAGVPSTDTASPAAAVAAAAPAVAAAAIPSAAPADPAASSSAPTGTAPSTGAAKLGIKKYGTATGEFIPLQGEKLVVGRFDASTGPVDIDLTGMGGQEHISRRHAELYQEGGVWMVRDLGSTNGVYVKRKGEAAFSPRLQEPAALADGDEIAFGNLMLSFHQG